MVENVSLANFFHTSGLENVAGPTFSGQLVSPFACSIRLPQKFVEQVENAILATFSKIMETIGKTNNVHDFLRFGFAENPLRP